MRRAMICVSVMLALLQLWPMLFGHRIQTSGAAAATPEIAQPAPETHAAQRAPAVFTTTTKPSTMAVSLPARESAESCYRHYERIYAMCDEADRGCRMAAADDWDLCEARGVWPD